MQTGEIRTEFKLTCGMTIGARIRRNASLRDAPLVLHLHGGAFQEAPGDCSRCVSRLLENAGAAVVSADYPAGPAHPFPAALEAAYDLLQQLYKNRAHWAGRRSKLFVAGEEAGGNLAAALAMLSRDRGGPALAGQILLSPMLDSGMATRSIRAAKAGPVGCKWADGWRAYLGGPEKACHPYANPAASLRLAGLAPALVITAEDDPMRDESLSYSRRLQESGVVVRTHVLPAPTRWPDALAQPDIDAPCCAQAQAALTEFFADPASASLAADPAFSSRL